MRLIDANALHGAICEHECRDCSWYVNDECSVTLNSIAQFHEIIADQPTIQAITEESSDKYRWHDLRKDPTDLPKDFYDFFPCLIAREIGEDAIITEYSEYSFIDNFGYCFIGVPQDEVIAWKCIEPFEVEE